MYKHYFISTLRNLRSQRFYSFINIAGLAIGVAICLLVFMYVRYEMSYDRHFPDAERIFRVAVSITNHAQQIDLATTPTSLITALKSDCPQLEGAARLMTNPETLVRNGAEKAFYENRIFHIDPEFLNIYQFEFIHGDASTCLNQATAVIITEEIALKYFVHTDVIGHMLDFGYGLFHVTGVIKNIPPNSHLEIDFLLPLPVNNQLDWSTQGWDNADGQTGLAYSYVKLRAASQYDDFVKVIRKISENYPGGIVAKKNGVQQTYSLQPISDIHLYSHCKNEIKTPGDSIHLIMLSVLALLVVFIACFNHVNFANMHLSVRIKELAVRKIIGASRNSMLSQYVAETMFLIVVASCFALVLIGLVLPWFNAFMNSDLHFNYVADILFLAALVVFLTFIALVTGGYQVVLRSVMTPMNILRGIHVRGMKEATFRKGLIICQFIVSITLIIFALIISQQLRFMKNAEWGFNKKQLFYLSVPTGSLFGFSQSEKVKNEFKSHHSIIAATATSFIPGTEKDLFKGEFTTADGHEVRNVSMNILMADHDFLTAFGLSLLSGRTFTAGNLSDANRACLINEAALHALGWHSPEEAVGRIITDFEDREIIGVIKDFHYQSLHRKIEPLVLMNNSDFFLYVTCSYPVQQQQQALSFVRQKWGALFPAQPFLCQYLEDITTSRYHGEEKLGTLVMFAALGAIIVAALGLHGLTLYSIDRRSKEIGIRKVFGATAGQLFKLLIGTYCKWILLANIVAWPIAFFIMHAWLQNFAYRMAMPWWTYIFSTILVIVVAFFAVSLQTIRAVLANPVNSLKYE